MQVDRARYAGVGLVMVIGLMVAGCGAPPARTTLLRPSDMELNTQQIAEQLAASEFLRDRAADQGEPIILQPERLENLSDNRLSAGDQWVAMSRVLLDPRMLELLRSKNVRVQMPRLRSDAVARAGLTINEPEAQVAPTHLFRGTLRTIARAGGGQDVASESTQRRDTFQFEYTIVDARSRQVVWGGQSELARRAFGSLID